MGTGWNASLIRRGDVRGTQPLLWKRFPLRRMGRRLTQRP
jgi:hypothetical protein